MSHTKPDLQFAVLKSSQVIAEVFNDCSDKLVKQLIEKIHHALDDKVSVKIAKPHLPSIRFAEYLNASYAKRRRLYTELGYIISLIDKNSRCLQIHFKP